MENNYLNEIYNDFFNVTKEEAVEEINDYDYNLEIDNLYLDEE